MGREEVVMYFDLCRELINAGWRWCVDQQIAAAGGPSHSRLPELVAHLAEVQQRWLRSPFEDGSPPERIVEYGRRRVPFAFGVPIVGMEDLPPEEHVLDCDCPLCLMMADGQFGPSFMMFDGHHLELDDEFAFSLYETREEWEQEQEDFAARSERIKGEMTERSSGEEQPPDTFDSVWSGKITDVPIPGDAQGHLLLAFLLTEVVSVLQSDRASEPHVKELNQRFVRFRQSEGIERHVTGKNLQEYVELLGGQYPNLVSRAADLQSQIAEVLRRAVQDA